MNKIKVLKDKTIIGLWENQLNGNLKSDLENAGLEKIFILDFEKMDIKNSDLGDLLINNPLKAIGNLYHALHQEQINDVDITITNFSPINQKKLTNLRTRHLNKLISVEGIVEQKTSVEPKVRTAAFMCSKCGCILKINQDFYANSILKKPDECYESQGGCGRVSSFKFLPHLSEHDDYQEVLITNPYYEKYRRELVLHCYNIHCDQVLPGDTVTINGVYSIDYKEKRVQDTFLLVQGFESSQSLNLDFTEKELKKATEIAESKEYWNHLVAAFAPSIYGATYLKEAALLQQFGGNWYNQKDGTTKRGSIHTLFVGDPGTVKSKLMQAAESIAPIYTKSSGKGSTIAGLTAGVGENPLGKGYIIKAGALVKANGGTCFLDEFDKTSKEVQGCLHTPMEQGIVKLSKMDNVDKELVARTAIMASMNPKDGRFDLFAGDFVSQINIDSALLTRFDLIFGIKDIPDPKMDRLIGDHIHHSLSDSFEYKLSTDFLRKYVHYSKKFRPIITDDVHQYILDWFVEERKIEEFHINWRYYEGIRRLTEASAKARFSNEVKKIDAKRAIRIFEFGLSTLNVKDLDSITVGLSEKERFCLRSIEEVLPNSINTILELGFNEEIIECLKKKHRLKEKNGLLYFGGL